MFNILGKFFDSNEKEINKLKHIVFEIKKFEEKFSKLKKEDFPKKTEEFKKRVSGGESLDLILPEAFAIVREAAKRAIGLRHYDVQLMAATVLTSGKNSEKKKRERKNFSPVTSPYLHSLTRKNVHLFS